MASPLTCSMTSPSNASFRNQDLRDRSFRNRSFDHCDFRGADLRGCDFNGSSLQGACFDQAKLGWTVRQGLTLALWIGLPTLLLLDAVSRLLFGALGRTPAEEGWPFVLALYSSLAIAGLATCLPFRAVPWQRRLWLGVTGLWFGALPGFCYAGLWTQNDRGWAIAGAILGGVVALGSSLHLPTPTTRSPARWSAFFSLSLITAYGFAFLMGAWAIAFLAVAELLPAMGMALLTLIYLLLTLRGGWLIYRHARLALGTSFCHANLTGATFADVNLKGGHFEEARQV